MVLLTFRVVGAGRQTEVTLALALLHGGRPQVLHALAGRQAGVREALDRAHLLAQATPGQTLGVEPHGQTGQDGLHVGLTGCTEYSRNAASL